MEASEGLVEENERARARERLLAPSLSLLLLDAPEFQQRESERASERVRKKKEENGRGSGRGLEDVYNFFPPLFVSSSREAPLRLETKTQPPWSSESCAFCFSAREQARQRERGRERAQRACSQERRNKALSFSIDFFGGRSHPPSLSSSPRSLFRPLPPTGSRLTRSVP